jgi:hypothetical protein
LGTNLVDESKGVMLGFNVPPVVSACLQILGNIISIEDVLATIKQRFNLLHLANIFFACLFKW